MKLRALLLLAIANAVFCQIASTVRPNGWIVRPAGRLAQADRPFPQSAALSPDGRHLLVLNSGMPQASVSVFDAKTEKLISVANVTGAWLGLAFSPNGRLVYVGGGPTGAVLEMQLSPEGQLGQGRILDVRERDTQEKDDTPHLIGDVAVTPDGRMVYAADVLRNRVLVINLSSGRVIERFPAGLRPYRIAFHPDGNTYFVTGWADGSVTQYETLTGRRFNASGVGPHATDIAWRDKKTQVEEGEEAPWAARLFVPAANTNSVYALAVSSSKDLRVVERIPIGLFIDQPVGMTPSAVALSPDQSRLYVACSDANAIAVLNVSGVKTLLLGFIPTGEYPTTVRTLADGRLVVLAADGTVRFLTPPSDADLAVFSGTVLANSALKEKDPRERPISMSPIPFTPGEPTPISNIVYILKDGAPHTASTEQVLPNHYKLAREFTPLTFTATGSDPIEGLYWSTAAIVPDFVRKINPVQQFLLPGSKALVDPLDFAAQPPAGYLWNQTPARLYGINPTIRTPRGIVAAPSANTEFSAPDPSVPDTIRAQAFLKEFGTFEQQQNLPKLLILHLAGDRAQVESRGQRTSQAREADNDYALGLIIERLSHSKFWPKMAIFIAGTNSAETNHRATALVVSPFATRGKAAPGAFNTLSILRTIEHILGLAPMTQFDAGATPLDAAFQLTPDLRPYDAERPRVSIDAIVQ